MYIGKGGLFQLSASARSSIGVRSGLQQAESMQGKKVRVVKGKYKGRLGHVSNVRQDKCFVGLTSLAKKICPSASPQVVRVAKRDTNLSREMFAIVVLFSGVGPRVYTLTRSSSSGCKLVFFIENLDCS